MSECVLECKLLLPGIQAQQWAIFFGEMPQVKPSCQLRQGHRVSHAERGREREKCANETPVFCFDRNMGAGKLGIAVLVCQESCIQKGKPMLKKSSPFLLAAAAALMWFAAGASAADKADKADTQAKKTAERFLKAMKAEDVQGILKVVEVPFFLDGKKVIKNREVLKNSFASIFAKKDLTQIEYEIKEVQTCATFQEKMSEKERKMLNEVLNKNDRIVIITVKPRQRLAVMVRIRDGKPFVAGIRD